MKCDDCRYIDVDNMTINHAACWFCKAFEMYFDFEYELEVFAKDCRVFSLKEGKKDEM